MLGQCQIAVLVPAYNEARLIETTLRGVPEFVDRVVVVDDGSTDDTSRVARRVTDARIEVLRHARNRGVGAALCTGYSHAFAGGADIVAVMAADAQMDPRDLPALLAPLLANEADYAKGNRLAHPQAFSCMPLSRFVGNHLLSLGTRLSTGLCVADSQCGYTALHRRAAERVPWAELWHGYGYPNDLLGMLARAGARVRDVVVRPVYATEQSGVRLHHALFVVPLLLLRIVWRRLLRQLAHQRRERAGEEEWQVVELHVGQRVHRAQHHHEA